MAGNRSGREATVMMAKCQHQKKPFGIRTERMGSAWCCTWAFMLSEKAAGREGYSSVSISGQVDISDEYPGCPYCGAGGWFKCGGCGKLNCFKNDETTVTCAWCGRTAGVREATSFDLTGGGY